ncbi:MAG: hypothetical protein C4516_01985 [Oxalobacter sp.]|jgi:hypothetical protein|nr:MAG: hypothetical protein C4516_01985 [Oxalobacter sp.]
MSRASELAKRRAELLTLSDLQRAVLTVDMHAVRHAMTPSGMGASLLETIRQHKLLAVGGVLALTFIQPRRLMAGLEMGLVGWGMWQKFAPVLQNVRGHFSKK